MTADICVANAVIQVVAGCLQHNTLHGVYGGRTTDRPIHWMGCMEAERQTDQYIGWGVWWQIVITQRD